MSFVVFTNHHTSVRGKITCSVALMLGSQFVMKT